MLCSFFLFYFSLFSLLLVFFVVAFVRFCVLFLVVSVAPNPGGTRQRYHHRCRRITQDAVGERRNLEGEQGSKVLG